jgi:hypothetical protein
LGLAPGPERLAGHQLHRDEDLVAELADVEGRDDVRMGQARGGLSFALQPAAASLRDAARSGLGLDQLDGHAPIELRVA